MHRLADVQLGPLPRRTLPLGFGGQRLDSLLDQQIACPRFQTRPPAARDAKAGKPGFDLATGERFYAGRAAGRPRGRPARLVPGAARPGSGHFKQQFFPAARFQLAPEPPGFQE